ncbi:MAG: phenylalanine--tRNA ligase subunit beta [Bacteroidales bacterium]|nr:phenylalanine--tRNA ligase subunit beta [Bacteroidales bacterium]
MKISYNWLKQYIDTKLSADTISTMLTSIGLEVESMEEHESVKGGLEGFVIGKVITCEKHPNAKNLSLTTVHVGGQHLLNIVCGAPNVAAGQKVVVATIGTTIYMKEEEFKIKKSKIRGEDSEGMICAEDELGLGTSHDGIMVLDSDAKVGLDAKDYFNIEKDYIFEIGLTPNRIDAASHLGVARDLVAFLSQDHKVKLLIPDVSNFEVSKPTDPISVFIENTEACIRYSGLSISGIEVKASPDWLKQRMEAIGLKSINNVVDVTNFILHELGQPLHAFDRDKIKGNKVIIKTLNDKTPFVCLDESTKELSSQDLMICNQEEGMCIAGVFGGLESGVSNQTTSVFLESACFNPVYVRKTARRHGLNTDSSFRFERGTDPNMTITALKRASLLILEVAGGKIDSEIIDIYPEKVADFPVQLSYRNIDRLIGNQLDRNHIKQILQGLEIKIVAETSETLDVLVPPYRVDVKREADVIEEILRIYGYNYVQIDHKVQSTISHKMHPDSHQIKNLISDFLTANGFHEIMSNSLTKAEYYKELTSFPSDKLVTIHNPLSQDLNAMRQSLLFGGLEAIAYNANHKNASLKLYEFGNSYFYNPDNQSNNLLNAYSEEFQLAFFISGNRTAQNWLQAESPSGFYDVKTYVEQVILKSGIQSFPNVQEEISSDIFDYGLSYTAKNQGLLAEIGSISPKLLKAMDIDQPVYFGLIHWDQLLKIIKISKVVYTEIPKFPIVRRDLAMIVDQSVTFSQLEQLAYKQERKILRKVSIFDVYQGEHIPEGKKSYALSFYLQDETKTLNDKHIDKIINHIASAFTSELQAQIRS